MHVACCRSISLPVHRLSVTPCTYCTFVTYAIIGSAGTASVTHLQPHPVDHRIRRAFSVQPGSAGQLTERNAVNTNPMRSTHAVLVLALVLSAAVAGRAQDAAAGAASPAEQPQQTDVAAATEQTQPAAEQTPEQQPVDAAAKPAVEEVASSGDGAAEPAAEQTPEQQPVDAAAKPAVEEVASSGDGAAEQPQSQPDPAAVSGEAASDDQPANSTRVFTAEQLAELQQQIQQAIDLQRQHKEVCIAETESAQPCVKRLRLQMDGLQAIVCCTCRAGRRATDCTACC